MKFSDIFRLIRSNFNEIVRNLHSRLIFFTALSRTIIRKTFAYAQTKRLSQSKRNTKIFCESFSFENEKQEKKHINYEHISIYTEKFEIKTPK